jgi:hypothetical protein
MGQWRAQIDVCRHHAKFSPVPRKELNLLTTLLPRLTFMLIAAVLGTSALAQVGAGKTSEQVRAEPLAAIRDGDLMMANGLTPREVNPDRDPAEQVTIGKTNEQARAEVQAAIRNGELMTRPAT